MTYSLTTDNPPPVSAQFAARAVGHSVYPFNRMEVGHMASFPAPNDMIKINRAAHGIGSRKGWKFAVRRQPDGSINVWRIA